MKDLLNKRISEYNRTVRGDYGIYLTKEQKDVIIDAIEEAINYRSSCKSDSKEFDLFYCAKEKKHPLKRCEEQCGWCEGIK